MLASSPLRVWVIAVLFSLCGGFYSWIYEPSVSKNKLNIQVEKGRKAFAGESER